MKSCLLLTTKQDGGVTYPFFVLRTATKVYRLLSLQNDGSTLCTQESPCDVCKDWLPEAWEALNKALRQKQKRKAAAAQVRERMTVWMTRSKSTPQKTDCKFLPSRTERTGRLGSKTPRRERKQPPHPCLRLRMSGLPGHVTRSRVRQFHQVYLWWDDLLGPTALPGPRDVIAADCTVVNGVTETVVTGLRDDTSHLGLVTHLGVVRLGNGPDRGLRRDGPALPGRLILWTFWNPTTLRGGLQMSGHLPPIIISITTRGHRLHLGLRLIVGPCQNSIIMEDVRVLTRRSLGRPMCPDVMWNCLKRTITVIQSPPRPAGEDD